MHFSKKNYKIKITGRAGLIYQENGKSLEVDSEMLAGPTYDIVIYRASILGWSPPDDAEFLSDSEKASILQNIKTHFEAMKYQVDIA
jgi:hypothetical protein